MTYYSSQGADADDQQQEGPRSQQQLQESSSSGSFLPNVEERVLAKSNNKNSNIDYSQQQDLFSSLSGNDEFNFYEIEEAK